MQQLEIEHKENEKTTEKRDRRESKGRVLAISRRVYRILNSDVYYVESESDNTYYFVKYEPSVFEWCSCLDNSTRHVKCKHIFGIEFSIRLGTLKDIDKLPAEAKRYPSSQQQQTVTAKSWESDNYDF